jgi:hypothetical protein
MQDATTVRKKIVSQSAQTKLTNPINNDISHERCSWNLSELFDCRKMSPTKWEISLTTDDFNQDSHIIEVNASILVPFTKTKIMKVSTCLNNLCCGAQVDLQRSV